MSTSPAPCPLGISRETLSAWRDRALADTEARRLTQHVVHCPACQRRLDQFARIAMALQRAHEPDLRAHTWRGIQEQLVHRNRRPTALRRVLHPHRFGGLSSIGGIGGIGATALVVLVALLALVIFAHRPNMRVGPGVPGPATHTATAIVTQTPPVCPNFPAGYHAQLPDPNYTSTTVYADIPLPSYSLIVPDDASGGVRGYAICSAGTVASISSYMSAHLTALGWATQGGGVWTKNGYTLTVQITSPTNWTISWRDPDLHT